MPAIVSEAQYIVYASLSFLVIFLYLALSGVRDYIVARKSLDYAARVNKRASEEFMKSLEMDDLDEHFAQNPDAIVSQY